MKKFFVSWSALAAIFLVANWVLVMLDMRINSWILGAIPKWHWYNYVTSIHSFTGLYLQHFIVWLAAIVGISAVFSAVLFRDK